MNVGPLRRITAGVGLLALLPVTWLLATGALTPQEAAMRAVVVAVVVVLLGKAARGVLIRLLHRVERRTDDELGAEDHRAPTR